MVAEHYSKILAKSAGALEALKGDSARLSNFTAAHNRAEELDNLDRLLAGRAEEHIFRLARVEYQHALYAVAFGQYRQAHVSLRLFLELSLCSVLFSAHEIDARLWMRDRKDANWTAITSSENGVFSKLFVGAFFEEMTEKCDEYRALASKLYRELSEYVHGNKKSFDGLEGEIEYKPELMDAWDDRADTATLVVKFAFLCRYMSDASAEVKAELEHIALGNFGEVPAVQALYEGTK